MPPNLPPGRLATLQAAVKETLNAPALVAEGERSQRYIDYLDAVATRKNAQDVVTYQPGAAQAGAGYSHQGALSPVPK